MKKKGSILLLGLIVVLGGWWFLNNGSQAQPEAGVLDVWATWGDEPDQLQILFDRYSQASGVPVRVTTRVRSDDLLEALAGAEPPDLVILSGNDLVAAYAEQGLVERLAPWIEAGGIDLEDVYPALRQQCQSPEGATLCLPWGGDVDALFWNKDLFAAAGLDPEHPPQTMEEMVAYAEKLTRRDEAGELEQVGFIPDLPRPSTELYARMFGGAFYGYDGALALDSQAAIEALNWQKQFYNLYGPEDLKGFVSSFTPYTTSAHPTYAGRRLSCQQCHRAAPIQNNKTPDVGFFQGRVAMMIDGQWQAWATMRAQGTSPVNYGLAPVPPLAVHPERANSAVVRGPVVVIPAGATDKEAAGQLLAWMMSPEVVAEAAYVHGLLPTSRTAAQDPRLQQIPDFGLFLELMAQANAGPAITTPISQALNEALGEVETTLLHKGEGDPASLLDGVQAELAPRLK